MQIKNQKYTIFKILPIYTASVSYRSLIGLKSHSSATQNSTRLLRFYDFSCIYAKKVVPLHPQFVC